MSATQIAFVVGKVNGTRENATRESEEDRQARAKTVFSQVKAFEYLGHIPLEYRQKVAKGESVTLPDGRELSLKNKAAAQCILCHGVHDLKKPRLSGLITFYRNVKTSAVIALSDTCREKYVGGFFGSMLTNPDAYFGEYPKSGTALAHLDGNDPNLKGMKLGK